ncbi:MAG: hypothetical protein WAV57_19670, partial [Blautia wexlerae]
FPYKLFHFPSLLFIILWILFYPKFRYFIKIRQYFIQYYSIIYSFINQAFTYSLYIIENLLKKEKASDVSSDL